MVQRVSVCLWVVAMAAASIGAAAAARSRLPDLRFEVRDFQVGRTAVPFPATASRTPSGVMLRGESADVGLALEAEVVPGPDATTIGCAVQDLRGADRALTVRVGMPLHATGWQWWDDVATARVIQAPTVYERVQSWAGLREVSVYPFCALSGRRQGVALAVDVTDPRVYRFRYDAGHRVLWAEVDLGLAAHTRRHPGSADFAFLLYSFPPEEGFRGALQRYYDLFPGFARRRVAEEGIWLLGLAPERMTCPWDFGLRFDEGGQHRAGYDVAHSIQPYVYTEPWGKYEHFGRRPTADGRPRYGEEAPLLAPAEMRARIIADVSLPLEVRDPHFGGPRAVVAQALENSAIEDARGQWVFRHWTDEWSRGDWLSNVTCNPDPELPRPNRASIAWDMEIEPGFHAAGAAGGALSGVYLDSIARFMGFANESFRRAHWEYADSPLVPSEATRGPAQLHAFACVEFARQVAEEMRERGLLVIANTFRPEMQYFTPYVDVLGAGETSSCGLASDEHYRYLRAYAGPKPVSWMDYSFVDRAVPWERKEQGMRRCLFYAVHPGTGPFADPEQFEPSRPLYRLYEPAIARLGRAGWQPVTRAWTRASAEGRGRRETPSPVLVERYGAELDSLCFTLRNPTSDPVAGELVALVSRELTRARDLVVWDVLAAVPRSDARVVRRPASVVVPFRLEGDGVAALRIATRSRLLREALEEAGAWLARFAAEARWHGAETGAPARAALADAGVEAHLKSAAAAATPQDAALSASKAVSALCGVVRAVEAPLGRQHERRCLGLPLRAAALAASKAAEIAAGLYLEAPAFALEGGPVPVVLHNASGRAVAGWRANPLAESDTGASAAPLTGAALPSGRSANLALVTPPVSGTWGWQDLLIQAEVQAPAGALSLLCRVAVRSASPRGAP